MANPIGIGEAVDEASPYTVYDEVTGENINTNYLSGYKGNAWDMFWGEIFGQGEVYKAEAQGIKEDIEAKNDAFHLFKATKPLEDTAKVQYGSSTIDKTIGKV